MERSNGILLRQNDEQQSAVRGLSWYALLPGAGRAEVTPFSEGGCTLSLCLLTRECVRVGVYVCVCRGTQIDGWMCTEHMEQDSVSPAQPGSRTLAREL